MATPIKIGFDLDGVILYNPIRVGRPLITGFKRLILKKPKTTFTIPHTSLQKKIWTWLHKTSFYVAPGFADLRQLVKEGKVEAYLITARFDFLKPDLDRWLQKIEADKIFTQVYFNRHNQQPHLYKREVLQKIKPSYFIEDNWDIVKNLAIDPTLKHTKIYWIYNLFDWRIPYPYRYGSLKKALDSITYAKN